MISWGILVHSSLKPPVGEKIPIIEVSLLSLSLGYCTATYCQVAIPEWLDIPLLVPTGPSHRRQYREGKTLLVLVSNFSPSTVTWGYCIPPGYIWPTMFHQWEVVQFQTIDLHSRLLRLWQGNAQVQEHCGSTLHLYLQLPKLLSH